MPGFAGIGAFLRGSDFLATLPGLLRANLLRGFAVAEPPFACPPMPMYTVWHLRHQADPMHQWLRGELQRIVAPALAAAELPASPSHDAGSPRMKGFEGLPALPLPQAVRSRFVTGVNGLDMHVLEAGAAGRPVMLLLHGFPELAYSWRKLMLPLAQAGFHVLAPDQRGYGRTTGWSADYDADLRPFGLLNLARDAVGLVAALGHRQVACSRRPRLRRAGGGLVRAAAARHLRRRGADERALRRAAALPFGTADGGQRRRRGHATPRWPHCRGRASTTSITTRRARRMPRCGIARRACTTSCAPTTT